MGLYLRPIITPATAGGDGAVTDTSWIPLAKLAREIGVHPRTVRRWLRATESEFPSPVTFHGRYYFRCNEIRAWQSRGNVGVTKNRVYPSDIVSE